MFRSTSDNWGTIGSQRRAVMESLENRQFLSASTFENVAATGPTPLHAYLPSAAVEQSLSHHDNDLAAPGKAAKKVKKARKAKAAAGGLSDNSEPTLAGKWTGVAIIDKGNIAVEMSAKLKEQTGKVVSGTIKMAAVMGSKPIKSNLIIDPYNNCRMVLSGNGSVGGLTAAASPDGKSIVGRWTWNVKGLWVTGTFKLTKVA